MSFQRGFKSQCERRAAEFRKQLNLTPAQALQSQSLAEFLSVVVWSTLDIGKLDGATLNTLNDEDDDSWSALTMRLGTSDLVIYKPVRSKGRRNSVVMHELAHIVLGHKLADACLLEDGSLAPGNFSQDQEDEADWFAGALLLPRPALLSIRSRKLTDEVACREYIVSKSMLHWRMRMTGVDSQLARRRTHTG